MNVLFITASRLGDAVLSTGLLDHILRIHPQAQITIVCGPVAAPLFDGVPGRVETIILKKRKCHGHWIDLWKRVAGRRWDIVVDLRNSAVSRLIRARARHIYGPFIDGQAHKVVQNGAVMKLSPPPAPRLWLTAAQEDRAARLMAGEGAVLGVGPTANWIGKTWPAENFIALIARLTAAGGLLPHARVAVFAAPGEEQAAYRVLHSIPAARQIDLIARTDAGEAAACLARCALYVGNDSGLMHCAAAAGVPTFGLFGPSWPHIYAPWGPQSGWIATPQDFAALTSFAGYDPKSLTHTLMDGLTVDAVMAALTGFYRPRG